MGFWDWLIKPKELKRFEEALKTGKYQKAVDIGTEYESIPDELVQQAKDLLAIFDALHDYGKDKSKTEYINQIVQRANNEVHINLIDELNRTPILLGLINKTLLTGNFTESIKLAKSFPGDPEKRSMGFRKVANYISHDVNKLVDVIELILSIPKTEYRAEELRNLCFSRVLLKDFVSAKLIIDRITDPSIKATLEEIMAFAEHNLDSIEHAMKAAQNISDPVNKCIKLSIVSAILGNQELMLSCLNKAVATGMYPDYRDGILFNMAQSFAHVRQYEASLAVIKEIADPEVRFIRLGYILFNFPFPADDIVSKVNEMSKFELSREVYLTWLFIFTDFVFSEQMDKAAKLLHSISNDDLKSFVSGFLVDILYALQSSEEPS